MNICVWKKNLKRLALSMLFQKNANILLYSIKVDKLKIKLLNHVPPLLTR